MEVAQRIQGINEYYFSQKLREIDILNKTGNVVLNLGIGSPDLSPHPDVVEVLNKESIKPNVHAYQSYKGIKPFRDAIATWYKKWYGVKLNADTEILPLIGSKEGIMHICMTYINPGDVVLIPNPGYPTYRSAATIAGASVVDYILREENNWFPDLEELEKKISGLRTSRILMWVNYPHMPTGQLPSEEMFSQLVAFGKKHKILVCHDNPYSFILNEKPMSLLAFDKTKEVVIELNSLSKSHNMAGWRVGMLCGANQRIDEVIRFKSNMDSGMFLPLQMAAAKALTLDESWHQHLNQIYTERREKVYEMLNLLKCSYSKKQAGLFVWASIPSYYNNAFALSDEILKSARVFITPGGIFGSEGESFIRVSLCSPKEKFIDAIKRIKAIL